MCGIAGIWSLDSSIVSFETIKEITDVLDHRGPDGEGYYISNDGALALGHKRLSILDISDHGLQPLLTEDKNYAIIFNGEIYNFIELKEELKSLGYFFHSNTDTEVLLKAYIEWGENCQLKLNGMWAFAIWDNANRSLFLSRDRFGIKPLFYLIVNNFFVFASELKSLAKFLKGDLMFDNSYLTLALNNYSMREAFEFTLLKNVKKLLPGHSIKLKNQRFKIKRWWNTLDHLIMTPKNQDEQAKDFYNLFKNACALRVRSDVPYSVSLSGGIDSSSVACMLDHIRAEALFDPAYLNNMHNPFFAEFPNVDNSELPYAMMVTNHLKSPLNILKISMDEVIDNVENIIFSFEDIEQLFASLWFLYRHIKNNGISVSIDGHGGDELLAGYLARYHSLMGSMSYTEYPIAPYAVKNKKNFQHTWDYNILKLRTSPSRFDFGPTIYESDFPFKEDLKRIERWHVFDRQLYIDTHFSTLPKILRNFDRMSMAHGVEVRTPFLDWRVLTYCLSLPISSKYRYGVSKFILRKSLKKIIPDGIRTRLPKLGFEDNWKTLYPKTLKPFILDHAMSTSFNESCFWDGKKVSKYIEDAFKNNKLSNLFGGWKYIQAHVLMKKLNNFSNQ